MSEVVVHAFKKNRREEVRATLDVFKGVSVANVRIFVGDSEGEMRATPKGITLRVEQLPELRQAVDALIARAAS